MPSVYVKQVQPYGSWQLASAAQDWQNLWLLFNARRLCSLQVIAERWGPDPTHYTMGYCLAFTLRGSLLATFITTIKRTCLFIALPFFSLQNLASLSNFPWFLMVILLYSWVEVNQTYLVVLACLAILDHFWTTQKVLDSTSHHTACNTIL